MIEFGIIFLRTPRIEENVTKDGRKKQGESEEGREWKMAGGLLKRIHIEQFATFFYKIPPHLPCRPRQETDSQREAIYFLINNPAASSGVLEFFRHAGLDPASSPLFIWIPAFAGMTDARQAAGYWTRSE